MQRFLSLTVFLVSTLTALAQERGFEFGKITHKELQMTHYDRDSSAVAVVLHEFGDARIENTEYQLVFDHHIKIKILKKDGLDKANFVIPLYKSDGSRLEKLLSVQASTFNYENGFIKETKFDERNILTEKINDNWSEKKIILSDVRVGSVIEIIYTTQSPFIFNFKKWEYQSDIPKIQSEYWAKIPGNYIYNIALRGFQKLSKNENAILKECIKVGSGYAGGYSADCIQYKFGMKDIPAFVEEEYVTSKANFLSAINFELSEVRHFDGRIDKITKEWKDADVEIRTDENLGQQLKKGKDIYQAVEPQLVGMSDPLAKAKKIYHFLNTWYVWDEYNRAFSRDGIKKAFDRKTGSSADINLALIAALRYADFDVEAVLLSTRANGVVTELHPVLSEFNYVIAKLNIGDTHYLLDATDAYLPFGTLAEKCLNGKGRAFPEKKPSYWIDLKPIEKYKLLTMLNLTMQPTGVFTGTLERTYYGYRAIQKRKDIASFNSTDAYVTNLEKELKNTDILSHSFKGTDVPEGNVTEKFEIEMEVFDGLDHANLLLNPFGFSGRMSKNPFKSSERLYPVDFGMQQEHTVLLTITYPESFSLISKPDKNALALPNNGGKFLFDVSDTGSKVIMSYTVALSKPVYTSEEYNYLKEFYSRIISVQNTDWIFRKK
jgi:hypothetical protein